MARSPNVTSLGTLRNGPCTVPPPPRNGPKWCSSRAFEAVWDIRSDVGTPREPSPGLPSRAGSVQRVVQSRVQTGWTCAVRCSRAHGSLVRDAASRQSPTLSSMRSYLLATAMVVLSASCGTDSVTTDGGTVEPDPVEAEVASLRVGCSNGPYFPVEALESAPPLLANSEVPEVAGAVASFLGSEEGNYWPQEGWRVLELAEGERVLVVHPGSPEVPSLAFMSAEWGADGWRWSRASGRDDCVLVVEPSAEDGEVVDWVVDPDAEAPGPDTTTLTLLATERGCASGQPMGARLHDPDVAVTDDAVLIRLTAEPREGDQGCPANPSQRVEIELGEPLRQRAIRDARDTDLGEFRDVLQALIDGDETETTPGGNEAMDDAAATSTTEAPREPDCDSEAVSALAGNAVDVLLARLIDGAADGDFGSAADVWTGFYAEPDAAGYLETLVESQPWLVDGNIETVVVDAFAFPNACPSKVVAVTNQDRQGTFAVLVDAEGTIQRIQGADHPDRSPELTSSRVILLMSPVEGFAVAYLESIRLPDDAITIDLVLDRTVITVPSRSAGPELLIVSLATPEFPTAYSVVLP